MSIPQILTKITDKTPKKARREIKFQSQVDDSTCTHACIAMLTDKNVKDVIAKLGNRWLTNKEALTPAEYLKLNNISIFLPTYNTYFDLNTEDNYTVLATVPSLNRLQSFHHILITKYNGILEYLDPEEGRFGRLYYKIGKYNPYSNMSLARPLSSHIIDIIIQD